jgi:hypothetical protein
MAIKSAVTSECKYPDLFSRVSNKCERFQNVSCDTRKEPQAPCKFDLNIFTYCVDCCVYSWDFQVFKTEFSVSCDLQWLLLKMLENTSWVHLSFNLANCWLFNKYFMGNVPVCILVFIYSWNERHLCLTFNWGEGLWCCYGQPWFYLLTFWYFTDTV